MIKQAKEFFLNISLSQIKEKLQELHGVHIKLI